MGYSRKYSPKLFSQGAYSFQKLRNETIIIADYEYAKIFKVALLNIMLWLNDVSPWIIFHQLNFYKTRALRLPSRQPDFIATDRFDVQRLSGKDWD